MSNSSKEPQTCEECFGDFENDGKGPELRVELPGTFLEKYDYAYLLPKGAYHRKCLSPILEAAKAKHAENLLIERIIVGVRREIRKVAWPFGIALTALVLFHLL